MGIFDFFGGKRDSKKQPREKLEFMESGSNFEERTGLFGERIIKGECRRVTYVGTSEEIKQIISQMSRSDRYIEGGRGTRRLRSASDDDE